MSERMFNLQQKADNGGRQAEAKVWSVLIAQVWSGFAGYCHAPPDVKTVCAVLLLKVFLESYHSRPLLRHSLNSFLNYFTVSPTFGHLYSRA